MKAQASGTKAWQRWAWLSLLLLIQPALAQESSSPNEETFQPVEVLVSGRQPGPRLWKVSKDDHVLWVFGLSPTLPKGIKWMSDKVDVVLANTDLYLPPPRFESTDSIPLKDLNTQGKRLKTLLPPDIYQSYLALRKDNFRFRGMLLEIIPPFFAAAALPAFMMKTHGLESGKKITKKINQRIKHYQVPQADQINISMPVALKDTYNAVFLDTLHAISPEQGVACFADALHSIHTKVSHMKEEANAWSQGDIDDMEWLYQQKKATDSFCDISINSDVFIPEMKAYRTATISAWLDQAEQALASNAATFTIMSMSDLLEPDGLLAALEARGYVVTRPQ